MSRLQVADLASVTSVVVRMGDGLVAVTPVACVVASVVLAGPGVKVGERCRQTAPG